MANVYEIGKGFDTIWALLEEEVIEDGALEDAFQNLKDDMADKFENCCKYIINENADIEALKAEEKRISAKRKAKENAVARLKAVMQMAMNKAGEKKLPCGTFTVSLQSNPASVVMDESYIENIPEKYLKALDPAIDKAKIKEDLQNGVDLEGIAHLEKSESLRIR